jgi:hypothetical protein
MHGPNIPQDPLFGTISLEARVPRITRHDRFECRVDHRARRKTVQSAPAYVKGWREKKESAMIETMWAFADAATSATTGGAFI